MTETKRKLKNINDFSQFFNSGKRGCRASDNKSAKLVMNNEKLFVH